MGYVKAFKNDQLGTIYENSQFSGLCPRRPVVWSNTKPLAGCSIRCWLANESVSASEFLWG